MMLPVLFVLTTVTLVTGLDNGLARTPPMGWLSWERFRCDVNCNKDKDNCISERLYMDMADRLVSDGYKDAGYEYVNIDDCWSEKSRDKDGRLQADAERFPHGIKYLADYVHSKGLKLGIYGDMGRLTCGGYPGSKFWLQTDAETFADWGIDSFKMDGCYSTTDDFPVAYPTMQFFLNKTGRPILFSCSWPAYTQAKSIPNYKLIAENCNLWRNWNDIYDSWESVKSIIKYFGDDKGNFSAVAGPGNFNDPDMLIIGDFGLSIPQEKVQMAMWSMMAAPLLMSNDLRNIRPESKAILLNKGAIAINQDKLGIMGRRVLQMRNVEFWIRPVLPKGSYAFALLNSAEGGWGSDVEFTLKSMGVPEGGKYNITEVFDGTVVGTFDSTTKINIRVGPTSVFFGKATQIAQGKKQHTLFFEDNDHF